MRWNCSSLNNKNNTNLVRKAAGRNKDGNFIRTALRLIKVKHKYKVDNLSRIVSFVIVIKDIRSDHVWLTVLLAQSGAAEELNAENTLSTVFATAADQVRS